LTDFSGLRHLSGQLQSLGISDTRIKSLSLTFLRRFPRLTSLWISGHSKDFAALSELTSLRELSLSFMKLDDLSPLVSLTRLAKLHITGGSVGNLEGLSRLTQLTTLSLRQVRGVADLSPIAALRKLEHIRLERLPHVERLPALRKPNRLQHIQLVTMNGLRDIDALADATVLEELEVCAVPKLTPGSFSKLVGHKTLRRVLMGLGSDAKNSALADLLSVPGRYGAITIG
jgi:Leucine-rich repeat (LRR) protein